MRWTEDAIACEVGATNALKLVEASCRISGCSLTYCLPSFNHASSVQSVVSWQDESNYCQTILTQLYIARLGTQSPLLKIPYIMNNTPPHLSRPPKKLKSLAYIEILSSFKYKCPIYPPAPANCIAVPVVKYLVCANLQEALFTVKKVKQFFPFKNYLHL